MKIKFIIVVPILFLLLLSFILTKYFISFEENIFAKQSYIIEKSIIEEEKNIISTNIKNIISVLEYNLKKLTNLQKENIKNETLNILQLIKNIDKNNINLSYADKINLIKKYVDNESLKKVNKYIFIYDLKGKCLYLPIAKKLEGKNLLKLKDIKGKYVVKDAIDIAVNGGGFYNWYFKNPKSKLIEEKIGYMAQYKKLNLFVGIAMYKTDIVSDSKKYIQNLLSMFKTKKNSYIFTYDDKGNTIAHIKKELIGTNRWDLLKNGRYLIQDIIKIAKEKDGGFMVYEATVNPKTNKPGDKISYVNEFKKFNWTIGTGFYTDDITKKIKKNQKKLYDKFRHDLDNIIMTIIIITIIIIIILWIVISRMSSQIVNYRKELELNNKNLASEIKKEVSKNREKENKLFEQTKMAAMGEMIGNIAHQWRQPLSIISIGATGLQIQNEHGILTKDHLEKTCESINVNAQYLSKTIDDFKNYIKGDRVFEKFNLKTNIENFTKLIVGTIKSNDIEVIFDLDKDININGYPNELIQCYINIFNNSKDALKNKNGKKYLFISILDIDDNVTIKFKDNAGGIEEKIKLKIFEPYFTTKHQSQGTGLGLNMTYKLITEGMGGNIQMNNVDYAHEDENHVGAEFIITLPKITIEKNKKG